MPCPNSRRKRSTSINIRMSPRERKLIYARIALSGYPTEEYLIRTLLGENIFIQPGKYQSDRLAVEMKKLRERLEACPNTEETREVLEDCRALLGELTLLLKNQESEDTNDRIWK